MKNKKIIIAGILIIVLSAIVTGLYYALIYNNVNSEEVVEDNSVIEHERDDDDNAEAEPVNIGELSPDAVQNLRLYVYTENDIVVGTEAVVEFKVTSEDPKLEGVNIVNTEDDSVLITLTENTINEENLVEFFGSYIFTPSEADFMRIEAQAENSYSNTGYISISDPVGQEENEEFAELVSDLGEYVNNIDSENLTDEQILDAVESWLNKNSNIAEAVREDNRIYYLTVGGIESFFTTEDTDKEKLSVSSTTDSLTSGTKAVEYFDIVKNDGHLGNENNISYLPSDITITNKNTLMLRPTFHADDGFDSDFFEDSILENAEDSECLEGGQINNCTDPFRTMEIIENGDLRNYGTIYLCAHGNVDNTFIPKYKGSNYLFCILDTTDINEWENFNSRYGNLIERITKEKFLWVDYDKIPEGLKKCNWKLYHFVSMEDVLNDDGTITQEAHYKVSVSSRYIMERCQNIDFDNALFVMLSCHGLGDSEFNEYLINHNAQAVIGSEESVFFAVFNYLADTVLTQMYRGSDNESAKLSNAWNSYGTAEGAGRRLTTEIEGTGHITVKDYKDAVKKGLVAAAPSIENESNNHLITDINLINAYLEGAKDYDNFNVISVNTAQSRDENVAGGQEGYFHLKATMSNILRYITKPRDYTFGGKGALSGIIYTGTKEVNIPRVGSPSITENNSEPAKFAEVKAYRFLNQGYEEKESITTDENGRFEFSGENALDWGHYVITSELASYSGEYSIILTADNTDGGNIAIVGGTSSISGYVEGKQNRADKNTTNLSEANITVKTAEENSIVKSTKSDESGHFTIDGLNEGSYILTFSHNDYEGFSMPVNVKKGENYNYGKGWFVLENNNSSKDIVLVLDVSSSMSGDPIAAVKNAAERFVDVIFDSDNNFRIALVSYGDTSELKSDFSKYNDNLKTAIAELSAYGDTNMEGGLNTAVDLLEDSESENKIIVLMSDGAPNIGKTGDSLIDYTNEIKNKGILLCTLGYFGGSGYESERSLMRKMASLGYHYEVSEGDLVNFFADIADQINGTKYIVAEAACPVDVTVTYNGETLSSAENNLSTRTSFGTLMFDGDDSDPSKILRLKEGPDYDIQINGTGEGIMNYTFSLPDENGEYTDVRSFNSISVTDKFTASTSANNDKYTLLEIDNDGDGKTDEVYRASENETAKPYNPIKTITVVSVYLLGVLAAIIFIFILYKKLSTLSKKIFKKKMTDETSYCPKCGSPLAENSKFCTNCGNKIKQ